MKKSVLLFLALLLTACNVSVGAPSDSGNPIPEVNMVQTPTITVEEGANVEVTISQTQWLAMTTFMGINDCTIEAKVVSLQENPLVYTLDGYRIRGTTDFDVNLGTVAACLADGTGAFPDADTITRALAIAYGYIARAAGQDYATYETGVAQFGTPISEDSYSMLFLGADVGLPVQVTAKPMQVVP